MSSVTNASMPAAEASSSASIAVSLAARMISDGPQLQQTGKVWRRLGESLNSPMAQFEWSMACAEAFGPAKRLHILAVMRDDEMAAAAPLYWQRLHGVRHLAMLGVNELHEPMDLVYRDQEALDELARVLLRNGQPLLLERVPASSPTVETFTRLCRHRAVLVRRPQMSWPYIELNEDWWEPECNLKAGRRSDVRRARRHAQERGVVSTEILAPDCAQLEELLDEAFRVEAASWKGQAGTALTYDAARAKFYRGYARAAAARGILRICFLRIDERAVAMQMAVEHGGAFWLLKIGYDAEFAHCSPGMLLLRDSIQYAARAGLKSYEFLGLVAPWTQVWTRQHRDSVSLRVYPASLRGAGAFVRAASGAIWRKWGRR